MFNILRPIQNGRRFADDTFNRIFLNENVRISIKISLKFVPKGPINNNPALVQIMAWRWSGDKPISEPMMVWLPTHKCVTRPQWVKGLFWLCLQWFLIPFMVTSPARMLNQFWIIVNWTTTKGINLIHNKTQRFSVTNMHLKMMFAKWWQFVQASMCYFILEQIKPWQITTQEHIAFKFMAEWFCNGALNVQMNIMTRFTLVDTLFGYSQVH